MMQLLHIEAITAEP